MENPYSAERLKSMISGGSERPLNQSPLEKIVSDRARVAKATVLNLLDEIQARANLNSRLTKEMSEEITGFKTRLFSFENRNFTYNPSLFKEMNSLRKNLEDHLLRLEQEHRREHLEFWRDTFELKKSLMAAFREYWDLAKRRELLASDAESFS